MKIKKFGHNKVIRLLNGYNGISFDQTHPMTKQSLAMFKNDDLSAVEGSNFEFVPMDRYVKLYESIEAVSPQVENIIPRRLTIKKRIGRRKNKNK
jgi:hypothetical protein